MERVTVDIDNHIAQVRLNRPDKHNGFDADMFTGVVEAGESLLERKDVRAVVLAGNGPSFSAGLDVQSFVASGMKQEDIFTVDGKDPENRAQRVAMIWKRLPMPVIASLHGVAYGAGCQLALAADIRIAAPDARMSVMEMKWGLIPDMTSSQTLRQLVGIDIAKELTFTARVVGAEEAVRLGLITRLADDPLTAATELAEEIANRSPDAIRAAKQLFEESWHAEDDASGLELEAELQKTLMGTGNQMESIAANFEKRDPNFKDPE